MKITFYGGTHSVTGSTYLLETKKNSILVDCGLHQAGSYCEESNFDKFPFNIKKIDAVCVTHAHIDHIGRIPQLVKNGFSGPIFSTPPTKNFAELLLLDSEHILNEEAEKKKKEMIYSSSDVVNTMKLWKGVLYHEKFSVGDFEIEFYDAGHVIGSSFIKISAEGKTVVFSGDLGNMSMPFIKKTELPPEADYALIESTYGNRFHENLDTRKDLLEDVIEDTVKRGGVLMIPAFALERTQEMIFELNELIENKRISRVPVFIDSPLAIKLTTIYQKYSSDEMYFNKDAIKLIKGGDAIFNFPGLTMSLTTEESKEINSVPPPKIIIAGSGMSHGGRILFHEKNYLSGEKNTILFVGFQAKGSLGRSILDGDRSVKIFGENIDVKCRVESISGYSAHADQGQLFEWIRPMRQSLKKLFIVQGEDDQALPFAQKVRDEFAVDAILPSLGESQVL